MAPSVSVLAGFDCTSLMMLSMIGNTVNSVDCKTVRIFSYSSTREQSNKRSGTRLKTESETGERRACEARKQHSWPIQAK